MPAPPKPADKRKKPGDKGSRCVFYMRTRHHELTQPCFSLLCRSSFEDELVDMDLGEGQQEASSANRWERAPVKEINTSKDDIGKCKGQF
jgi:hypothetical protein